MNNYNNSALNQLRDILIIIRNQMANHEKHTYLHEFMTLDETYVDLNLKLLIKIGKQNQLPTNQVDAALNQFLLEDDYEYSSNYFHHNEKGYSDSNWKLTDLNQIIGALTPMTMPKVVD